LPPSDPHERADREAHGPQKERQRRHNETRREREAREAQRQTERREREQQQGRKQMSLDEALLFNSVLRHTSDVRVPAVMK
jgi:hypothetical protein